MNRAKRRGLLKLLTLSIIISHERIHGYNIYKELTRSPTYNWKPSIGTLYRLLNEMVEEGYIVKEETMYGNKRIVYYKPASKGIEEFQRIASLILCKVTVGFETLLPAIMTLKKKGYAGEDIDMKLKKILTLLNEYFKSLDKGRDS